MHTHTCNEFADAVAHMYIRVRAKKFNLFILALRRPTSIAERNDLRQIFPSLYDADLLHDDSYSQASLWKQVRSSQNCVAADTLMHIIRIHTGYIVWFCCVQKKNEKRWQTKSFVTFIHAFIECTCKDNTWAGQNP